MLDYIWLKFNFRSSSSSSKRRKSSGLARETLLKNNSIRSVSLNKLIYRILGLFWVHIEKPTYSHLFLMKSNIRKIKKFIFNVFIKGFFIAYMFSSVKDSIAHEYSSGRFFISKMKRGFSEGRMAFLVLIKIFWSFAPNNKSVKHLVTLKSNFREEISKRSRAPSRGCRDLSNAVLETESS